MLGSFPKCLNLLLNVQLCFRGVVVKDELHIRGVAGSIHSGERLYCIFFSPTGIPVAGRGSSIESTCGEILTFSTCASLFNIFTE
jgi:hypothetical protein